MPQRILTAAILTPLVLLALWIEGLPLEILLYGSAAIAAWELTHMAAAWGQPPYRVVAIILAVLIPLYSNLLYDLDLTGVSTSIPVQNMETATRAAAILALAGAAALLTTYRLRGTPGRLLATFCVPAVIGGTLFHLNALRSLDRWTFGFGPSPLIDDGLAQIFHTLDRWAPEGLSWILFLLAVTIATDTAAYFVGKAIGKRKLAPETSPNKTWEGAIGGFCGAVAVGVAIELTLGLTADLSTVALMAAILGVTGQLGDLFESRLKRRAGLDDSGAIFPGHGGILDRMDSLMWNLPVLFHLVILTT